MSCVWHIIESRIDFCIDFVYLVLLRFIFHLHMVEFINLVTHYKSKRPKQQFNSSYMVVLLKCMT